MDPIYDADLWETQTGTLIDALANDVKFGGTKDNNCGGKSILDWNTNTITQCTTTKNCKFPKMKTIY